jgi:membrane protein insertase Oxa1/YidC/SpoIIIJ
MNYSMIKYTLGWLLMFEAAFFLVPIITALWYGEGAGLGFFFALLISAAVGVYWIYQSIFGIIQMIVLAKVMPLPKYTKEEMEQMLRDMKAKNAARAGISSGSASGERPRSLHHIDDDDEIDVKPQPKKQQQNPPKK